MLRNRTVDNAKRGQSQTKAMMSRQMPDYPVTGGWSPIGQTAVNPSTEANDDYQNGQRHQPGMSDSDNDWDDIT